MFLSGSVKIFHENNYKLKLYIGDSIKHSDGIILDNPLNQIQDEKIQKIILALFEASVGIIAITRLGFRKNKQIVKIVTEHQLPEASISWLQSIANLFTRSRSLISGNTFNGEVKFEGNFVKEYINCKTEKSKAVIAWSGGIDSTLCMSSLISTGVNVFPFYYRYYGKKLIRFLFDNEIKALNQISTEFSIFPPVRIKNCDVSKILDEIPYFTFRDNIDIDGWELFGRNLLFTLMLWVEALLHSARYIVLGLTAEDLHCTEKINNHEFYSECCQSVAFIKLFNSMIKSIGLENSPICVVPLLNMRKGAIIKALNNYNRNLLFKTHCCINDYPIEDGQCFSCYDKFWGILSTAIPDKLQIILQASDNQIILSEINRFTKFVWGKNNSNYSNGISIFDASIKQIERLLNCNGQVSSDLEHSKFHYAPVLAALFNFKSVPKYINVLFGKELDRIQKAYKTNAFWKKFIEDSIKKYFGYGSLIPLGDQLIIEIDNAVISELCL